MSLAQLEIEMFYQEINTVKVEMLTVLKFSGKTSVWRKFLQFRSKTQDFKGNKKNSLIFYNIKRIQHKNQFNNFHRLPQLLDMTSSTNFCVQNHSGFAKIAKLVSYI